MIHIPIDYTMKVKLIFFLLLSSFLPAFSQPWVKKMSDPQANFYEVKKSFNKHWKKEERKHKLRNFFTFNTQTEQESEGLMLYKRWEYTVGPRVFPSGDRNLISRSAIELKKLVEDPAQRSAMQANGQWVPMGAFDVPSDGGGAGRLNCVRFHPTQANTIFVGAPVGGLWKSTDAGATWNVLISVLPSLGVSDVAIDANNPLIMYLATGDFDAGDSPGIGIMKSIDGGATWQITGLSFSLSQGKYVSRIIINPANSNMLWAAAANGIYKSIDAGATWIKVLNTSNIRDLELQPGSTSTLYATTNTAFYKSTNEGDLFTNITTGLPIGTTSSRYSIAVTAANPNLVYLVSSNSNNNGFKGLYKSSDAGATFALQADYPNLLGWDVDGSDTDGQGWYTLSIAASPINENEIMVGGVNVWASQDGGQSWQINAHWYGANGLPYVHADIHDLSYRPGTSILFAGTDGGIFSSNTANGSWSDLSNGLQIAQMYRLGNSATNSSMVVQGWQDNGTNRLKNGQWAHVLGGDGMECFVDWSNANYVYGESQYGNINRSSDGGNNFDYIKNDIDEEGEWVTPWAQHPSNATTLFAGYKNVWKSTNRGNSWVKISNLNIGGITILEIAKSNPNYIYISNGSAIYKTTNGGATWIAVPVPSAGSNTVSSVAISSTDPQKIWLCRSGYNTGNKVYKSIDGGATWVNISLNLPNIPVNTIVNQAATNDGVFVGTDFGVYYTDNFQTGWMPYMNGLPNVRVDELEIHYGSSKLRAATYGRGLWESAIYDPNSEKPFTNFSADVVSGCPGFTVQFTDISYNFPTSWLWSFPGGTPATSTLQNPTVTYLNAGTYNNVTLQTGNAFGTDSVIKYSYIAVSPGDKPSIAISPNDTVCAGQSVNLKCSVGYSYYWYPSNFNNISFNTSNTGTYAVRVTDNFGCANYSDTVTVTILPLPSALSITMNNDTLTASAGVGLNLQWYLNGTAIIGATDSVYIASQTGTYTVAVLSANGCSVVSNSIVTGTANNLSINDDLQLYPNPSKTYSIIYFNSAIKKAVTLKITTADGKIVYTEELSAQQVQSGQKKLDLQGFAAGLYLVNLSNADFTKTLKLSVE